MYKTILFDVQNNVATITLNRPDKLNSFVKEMHEDLLHAFDFINDEKNNIRSALLTGSGKAFCSGQDLKEEFLSKTLPDGTQVPAMDLGDWMEKTYNPLVRKMVNLRVPLICAVNGPAVGAGASIALLGDIVIASQKAIFTQAFCKIGLIPDSAGTWILPRLVGHARALPLALLGTPITAEQAEQWGMIYQVTKHDNLMDECKELAEYLATQPTKTLTFIKKAFQATWSNTIDQQLDVERDLQTLAGKTHDHIEGVKAFVEKRMPEFKGK